MMFSSIGKFLLTASLYLISRQNFMVISLKDFSPAYAAITIPISHRVQIQDQTTVIIDITLQASILPQLYLLIL